MRVRWTNLALAIGVMALTVSAVEAAPKHKKKSSHKTHKVAKATKSVASGAENSLVGVTLFDSGLHVIALYGTPDTIQPANVTGVTPAGGGTGGGAGAPGGGFPGAGAAPGGPRGGGKGGGGGGVSPSADYTGPDEFGDEMLKQQGPPGGFPGAQAPGGPGGGRPGGRFPGAGAGAGSAFPGGAGPGSGIPGGAGGGNPGSGGGQAESVVYTRWTYVRGPSRYGFVFDKFNRVVQIEAIGIANPKVHTRRGITFGNNFASLIKTYGPPDGYDIAGDSNLTIRYLSHAKVAFRLTRLEAKKPVVVTGIVIAAAKG